MTNEQVDWLNHNISRYLGSQNRVKYRELAIGFDGQFGCILDNAELERWLMEKEMPVSNLPKKLGKRKPGRRGRPRKVLLSAMGPPKEFTAARVSPGVRRITLEAIEVEGRIYVSLESALDLKSKH